MILDCFLGSPPGIEIGRVNLLKCLHCPAQVGRRVQNVLDDTGNIEKPDPSREESCHRRLVGGIQHDWCNAADCQRLARQT